jgi:heavy metal translocating P-type ATPase
MALSLVLAGQSMVLGLGINLTPPDGTVRWVLHALLFLMALAVMLLLGRPLLDNTLETIRDREVSVELLFVASLLGAMAASLLNTFTGTGYVFYEVVAVVLVIYTFGRRLRMRTREKALEALRASQERHATALVEREGADPERVPVEQVRIGDLVLVPAGHPVPVDGELVAGPVYIDTSSFTGEPLPVVRRAGDPVRAGTLAVDSEVRVRVHAAGGEREIDRLFRALEEARLAPSEFQRIADRVTGWFLPVVLCISAATFLVWWWSQDWKIAVFHSMAVLLVACPCALGMATPVAVWGGLARVAGLGFAAKGGDFLDGLSRVDTVFIDKTGTLTEGAAVVVDFLTDEPWSGRRAQLRAAVAEAERGIAHPLAQALSADVDAAGWRVVSRRSEPGRGIEADLEHVDGGRLSLRIGEEEFAGGGAVAEKLSARLGSVAGRRVWLRVDGVVAGVFLIRERERESVGPLAKGFQNLGIQAEVLTGDPEAPATIAGLPVRAGLMAEEKAEIVRAARSRGRFVLVVGDGMNDSPAMAAAHTSIAVEGGAGVTCATAAAVVSPSRLGALPEAIAAARRIRAGIHSNMVFATVYNFIGVGLAAAGVLHPVVAALLMLVSSFVVSWRAMRF